MRLSEVIGCIEEAAPLTLQESWDNSGLQIGDPNMEVAQALLCVDVTEAVLDEAIATGCQLVLAHHPLLFHGLKTVQGRTLSERCVLKAIRHGVAIYAAHTNFDNWSDGVNARMAAKIGLSDCHILQPMPSQPNAGAGMVGLLQQPMAEMAFLQYIKEIFRVPDVRYSSLLGRPIKKVALCGGAGSFLLPDAIVAQADVFVSADFKHHDFFEANNQLVMVDIGHFESEQCTKEIFFDLMSKKIPTFAIRFSEEDKSPINHL